MGHVTIINCFIKKKAKMKKKKKRNCTFQIVLIAPVGICPEWPTKIFQFRSYYEKEVT